MPVYLLFSLCQLYYKGTNVYILSYNIYYMNISRDCIEKVKNLVQRFTTNTPILCDNHIPDGLPIDKPDSLGDLESTHPSERFQNIVQQEVNIKKNSIGTTEEVLEHCITKELRDLFASEYYAQGDERSCIKCYRGRVETEGDLPIRMVVPERYDDISAL